MGLHDFASGEVLTDAYMDEIARQGRIICTSSTRPSSPITGMSIYETDTYFTREWTGAAWRTLPKGILDRNTGSVTGGGGLIIGTEVAVNTSQCYFTSYDSTQEYKYSWRFVLNCPTTALTSFDVWVNKNASHLGIAHPSYVTTAGVGFVVTGFLNFTVAAGSITMDMSIVRTGGAGGGEIFAGGDFCLEHLGTQ